MENIEHLIKVAVKSLGSRSNFKKNELAYLALTSKPEIHLRDKLAWALQEGREDKFLVSREWGHARKRYDLAVLGCSSEEVLAVFELKVVHTLEATKSGMMRNVRKVVGKDIEKLEKVTCPNKFALLFAIHSGSGIDKVARKVVAYDWQINKTYKLYSNSKNPSKKIESKFREEMAKSFKNDGKDNQGEYEKAGEYLGIKTKLLYWLIQVKP